MSTEPASSTTEFAASTGFVGRRQELGALRLALQESLLGQGRLVMLAGEPGIGKTRTAQELADYAQSQGAQVLWGCSYDGEGAPPYWPWVQLLQSYVHQSEPGQLQSEMGAGAAGIAEIVSEVREKLPGLEPPPALDSPEQARFRLFDSISTFLKNAARRQPLVLVLDDLHWADRSSLLLLEFLAQELQSIPLLLIGTYRDVEVSRQHPLSQTLGSLIRASGFVRLHLPGLSQWEVSQILDLTPGWESSPQTVATIHQRTQGNPLFVGEILRGLSQAMLVDKSAYLTGIPEGVKDAIGRRLSHLSERCNQALTTASVIGREFDFRLLSRLSVGVSEEQMLGSIDEAVAAHLIEELPGRAEGYQFSHALIQETLASELSAARRVRLHARIGEALEEMYAPDVSGHAAELAYHFSQAEPVLGIEKLVRYSLLAGERALAAYAWEDALHHFQRGLEARNVQLKGAEPARDVEAAALLFGLGRAQEGTQERWWAGHEVLASFHRAFDYYVTSGDVGRAVDIAAHHISSNIGGELIAKALELVPPDSHDAGRLLSRYIMPLRTDYERSQQVFQRALSIAQQQQDLDLEMMTLVDGACVNFVQCHFQESLEQNLRAIELADRVDHPVSEAHARYDLMHVLFAMGDLESAVRHARAMLIPAERSSIRAWQVSAMEANENVSSARGDWGTAREFSERGLALDPRHTLLLGARALLEHQVGDLTTGEAYLERLLESVQRSQPDLATPVTMATPWYVAPAVVIPVIAGITGVAARFDVAEVIAQRVVSSPYVQLGPQNAARVGLALMAVQRGDAAAAGELYFALASMRGTMFPQCPWGHALATDRVLGLLAQTMGDLDQASVHFEDSVAFCRKAGYRPELAWTCHDYADALLRRRGPGDYDRAAILLDEAQTISSELGMRPLMERVVALQEKIKSEKIKPRAGDLPAYPDGLTPREVAVLLLVAAGKSNAEIAAELVLSIRTVERHISNIYSKTNSHNRADAAAFAFIHGLISSGTTT